MPHNHLMTASELGLTEAQYCGLVRTLEALESGKLDHENEWNISFNMIEWGGRCGTACCIGGTSQLLSGLGVDCWIGSMPPRELHNLFYPGGSTAGEVAYHANTKQAGRALRHYLMTGKENWKKAMKGD